MCSGPAARPRHQARASSRRAVIGLETVCRISRGPRTKRLLLPLRTRRKHSSRVLCSLTEGWARSTLSFQARRLGVLICIATVHPASWNVRWKYGTVRYYLRSS
eukprot:1144395-Prymnesium_polylepis.1